MLEVLFIINLIALILALFNLITLTRPTRNEVITSSVAVLLPVRDEIANIDRVVQELLEQKNLENLTLYVIDDHSTDGTSDALVAMRNSHLRVVSANDLPDSWLGKPHALECGYRASRASSHDLYITVDADVHFHPFALSRAISAMDGFDFISAYPKQEAVSIAERLMQPLLQWSWMVSLPVKIAHRFSAPSTAVANGQFFIIKADALNALDGFTSIAHQVLDDIQLAKAALRKGFKGTVIEGSSIASTRMYSSLSHIQHGYGKSLYPTFGVIGSLALVVVMAATSIVPFFFITTPLGFLAAIAIILSRVISALSSRNKVLDAIAHPVSAALFISLLFYSYRHRGSITWKGRNV